MEAPPREGLGRPVHCLEFSVVASAALAASAGVVTGGGLFGASEPFLPLDVGGDELAGGRASAGHCALALGDELHAHGLHLFLEVEVGLLLDAFCG